MNYTAQQLDAARREIKAILAPYYSGQKSCKRYPYLLRDYLGEIDALTQPVPNVKAFFLTKLSWIMHGRQDYPVCKTCGCNEKYKTKKLSLTYDYQPHCCAACAAKDHDSINLRNKTLREHFGGVNGMNPFQIDQLKQKIRETLKARYGKINPGQFVNRKRGYEEFLKNYYVKPLFSYEEYDQMCERIDRYHNNELEWECRICGYRFKDHVKTKCIKPDGIHATNISCPQCIKERGASSKERQLQQYVKSIYAGKIYVNYRKLLTSKLCPSWKGNKELDIYLPDIRTAIEFNGTYFHADPRFYAASAKIKEYTAEEVWKRDSLKRSILEKLDIKLLTVWEYDWDKSQDEIKQKVQLCIQSSS